LKIQIDSSEVKDKTIQTLHTANEKWKGELQTLVKKYKQ
jgi:hypothetical protein